MHDERPDQMTMIGLHKLASQFGDGLVPELYALLTNRARMLEENENVTEFPTWRARPPARNPSDPAATAEATVLPFPRMTLQPAPEKKAQES